MVPKNFRNNIRITTPKIGVERREEILTDIQKGGTFFPKGVHYKDMDESFLSFVKNQLNVIVDGEVVPSVFLTIQRYSEFSKTWSFTDEYRNIKMPFITVVRKPDPQPGTNYAGLYNIPGKQLWTYMKVPTNDGSRVGVDLYKIPQPTSVDISYEVRFFTNKMGDLNALNEIVQHTFKSRQFYVYPNGHPMPIILDDIGDESNINDFEGRRFYVQVYNMKLLGYILDEKDFKILPSISRILNVTEFED